MDILELLRSVAPDTAAKAVGVPPSTINTLERELDIRFPKSYRSFLLSMGYDTGGFPAMNRSHTTDLRELLAELPGPEERVSRYWRVSIERDLYDPNGADLYLDLSTSDGNDAQLIKFAFPPDPGDEPDYVDMFTLSERLRHSVFLTYVFVDPEIRHRISVSPEAYDVNMLDIGKICNGINTVLGAEGFQEFAPYRDKVAYFHRPDCTIIVWFRRIPSVSISATDVSRAALLVEKFRDHIPAPTTVRTYHPARG